MQDEFDFQAGGAADGYQPWVVCRRAGIAAIARRLCLPLGHRVEIWLRGGIRIRGQLLLREEVLFVKDEQISTLELLVDGVSFTCAEMESCVRLD